MYSQLSRPFAVYLFYLIIPQFTTGQGSVNTFVNVECQDGRADISMMFPGKISGQVTTISKDITQTCVFGVKEVESFSFAIPLDSCGTTKHGETYYNSLNITYFDNANRVYSVIHDYTCEEYLEKSTALDPNFITSKDIQNDASVNMTCIQDGIKVFIKFSNQFEGVIYTEEKNDKCIFESHGKQQMEFLIPVDSCGTTYNGDYYKNVIVIEYPNQFYGTPAKVKHRVQCRYVKKERYVSTNQGHSNRLHYEESLSEARTQGQNYPRHAAITVANYRTNEFQPAKVELKCHPNYMDITLTANDKMPSQIFTRPEFSVDACNFSLSSDSKKSSFHIPLSGCGTRRTEDIYQTTLLAEYVSAFEGKPLLVKHNLRCRYLDNPVIEGVGYAATTLSPKRAQSTFSTIKILKQHEIIKSLEDSTKGKQHQYSVLDDRFGNAKRPIQRAFPRPEPSPKKSYENFNLDRFENSRMSYKTHFESSQGRTDEIIKKDFQSINNYEGKSEDQNLPTQHSTHLNELVKGHVKDALFTSTTSTLVQESKQGAALGNPFLLPEISGPKHTLALELPSSSARDGPAFEAKPFGQKPPKPDQSLEPLPWNERKRLQEKEDPLTGSAQAILPTSIEPSPNPSGLSQTQFVTPLSVGIEAGIPSDMQAPSVKTRCRPNAFRIFIHFPQIFAGKIKNKANTCSWSGNMTYEMALNVPFGNCDTVLNPSGSRTFPFEIEYYSPDLPLVVGRTLHKAECGPVSPRDRFKIPARVDPVDDGEISLAISGSEFKHDPEGSTASKNIIRRSSPNASPGENLDLIPDKGDNRWMGREFGDINPPGDTEKVNETNVAGADFTQELTPVTNFQGAIECRKRNILVTLYFRRRFEGLVYSDSNISRCNFPIQNQTRQQFFVIPLDGCGTTKLDDGITYRNLLLIEYPKWAFPNYNNRVKQEIKCEYPPIKDEVPNMLPQIKHECRSNSMRISIKFENTFMGAIYTAQVETRCFFSQNITNTYNLEIPLDQCGTAQEGSKYSNKIIIDYGLIKESRPVSCLYSGLINFTLDPKI